MNDYVTYCAQAKLLKLMEDKGAIAARIVALPEGSVSIEMMDSKGSWTDIMLSSVPRVYTDMFTFLQLGSAAIDFDYPSAEFVITREKHDVLANVG